ncbi:ESX secretion-associated protein EspG [Amycolatopsis palatopharyngis]|uniref:ESX secretion-associated protein EspG n=1 Tax=Amycolatopsis palatopharyngis TaxID=187982 RepID=UPI000E23D7AA|nr:ESX secretion-associated protein EspG [Amycolatopsis palatopharyngis]
MSNSTQTVFELVDEIIAPLSQVVPRRPSPMEYLDPHFCLPAVFGERPPPDGGDLVAEAEAYTRFVAGMAALGLVAEDGSVAPEAVGLYRAFRGGFIRGVVTGVFADRADPLEVRFFGDEDNAAVLTVSGEQATLRAGALPGLAEWALDDLPDPPGGPGEVIEIHADERGVIPGRHGPLLDSVREAAHRPRLGTVLVDLTVRDTIVAEHPHGSMGLLDNDLGRYLLATAIDPSGHWVFWFAPATRARAEQWIIQMVRHYGSRGTDARS